ncbi:hypothetical protein K474DRAFT_1107121 [Panus rudis PR-1116 ss-1]|nr:hypothetical protein K474DRAFT_1107121 [Panus rudis PR-1116 ss-1]
MRGRGTGDHVYPPPLPRESPVFFPVVDAEASGSGHLLVAAVLMTVSLLGVYHCSLLFLLSIFEHDVRWKTYTSVSIHAKPEKTRASPTFAYSLVTLYVNSAFCKLPLASTLIGLVTAIQRIPSLIVCFCLLHSPCIVLVLLILAIVY